VVQTRRTEDPRVTVVVASRNRREELLSSLTRHRAPVVLVDNGSTDGTVEAVRRQHPDVEVVALPENVGARARNIGVDRVRTPFVAFADDDSWWAPGSLARGAAVLAEHPQLALVNARILVGTAERPDPICEVLAHSPLPRPQDLPGAAILGFVACAAMVRTDAFREAGGFDDVVRFPGEEERLSLDLAERLWQQVYLPDLVVHHHPSPLRHDAGARRRAVTRSSILTAVLRLPVGTVLRRVGRALAGDMATRRGVLDAVVELPDALSRRRPVSRHVLRQLETLRRGPAAPPPALPPVGTASTTGSRGPGVARPERDHS
jgi:glycosyltransferase involved in cell wall biosynthesis